MFKNFIKSYYGTDDGQMFNMDAFLTDCPLIVFDCSRNESIIKTSAVDVRVEAEFRGNIPANTVGCCLVIHEKVVRYNPYNNIIEHEI